MHKSQLVSALAEELRVSHQESEKIVRSFFSSIERGLVQGERTEIRGLGSFSVKEYPGYTGRNPKTGAAIDVPPKRLPFFRVGRELKAVVATDRKPIRK
ncbi:MAG: integration host factor subunit beta [Deltaproteobacteria bacterium]|jgi:integration host factor subunit beta|nr:integration host factor subunit beta [Deltaproteobacteria bacterium]